MGALLRTQSLGKTFAGFRALDGVNLSLEPGELKGIIGPNGAGKTTLFNIIAGLFRPSEGRVLLRDEDITGQPPEEICRRGIGKTFQIVKLFPHLNVLDNVRLAVDARARLSSRRSKALALDVLERLELGARAGERADALSHGEQRLLDIAIALASGPTVLLLDEPAAGMSPVERRRLAALIQELARDHAILLIEHDMEILLEVSSRVMALHQGRVIAEGYPDEVASNPEIRAVYFGADACS